MDNGFTTMTSSEQWWLLVEATKTALESAGYDMERIPGRGRSNMWEVTLDRETKRLAIRTSKDRWIAFPPLKSGSKWKTLDDVELVAVSTIDDWKDEPEIEVYLLEASVVRSHFDAAYTARIDDGQTVTDNFGMWVGLDADDRGIPASVGSGITENLTPIATYSFRDLVDPDANSNQAESNAKGMDGLTTIAEVLDRARDIIATMSGVPVDAVKLDCKIGH